MALIQQHVPFYREVFGIPDILADPFLVVGFQTTGGDLPQDFDYPDVNALLTARGVSDITTVDLFDKRADRQYDLNEPVPESEHNRYQTVFDIGTIEHVFDTRRCIENCMRMVRPNGFYFVVTPVHGYLGHGFHTFSPLVFLATFRLNGFKVRYLRFSSANGVLVERAKDTPDTLIWIVGRKTAPIAAFEVPQQVKWARRYREFE